MTYADTSGRAYYNERVRRYRTIIGRPTETGGGDRTETRFYFQIFIRLCVVALIALNDCYVEKEKT